MTATVVLLTLLLAPAASGNAAAPAACEVWTRGSETPPHVKEWFAHAADERVVRCPQAAAKESAASAPQGMRKASTPEDWPNTSAENVVSTRPTSGSSWPR